MFEGKFKKVDTKKSSSDLVIENVYPEFVSDDLQNTNPFQEMLHEFKKQLEDIDNE